MLPGTHNHFTITMIVSNAATIAARKLLRLQTVVDEQITSLIGILLLIPVTLKGVTTPNNLFSPLITGKLLCPKSFAVCFSKEELLGKHVGSNTLVIVGNVEELQSLAVKRGAALLVVN